MKIGDAKVSTRLSKVDAAYRGWSVGRVNNLTKNSNAKVNTVEDLEAIWAATPAPAEKVAVAA